MKFKVGDMFLTPSNEIYEITEITAILADVKWLSEECVQVRKAVVAEISTNGFIGFWNSNKDYRVDSMVVVQSGRKQELAKVIANTFVPIDFKYGHKKVLGVVEYEEGRNGDL